MVKIWVNLRNNLSLGRWFGVMVRVVVELGALKGKGQKQQGQTLKRLHIRSCLQDLYLQTLPQ
jgi:hypothetical protein